LDDAAIFAPILVEGVDTCGTKRQTKWASLFANRGFRHSSREESFVKDGKHDSPYLRVRRSGARQVQMEVIEPCRIVAVFQSNSRWLA
jgi:hypothetical protein